jgi:ParB/RepB/Spo0J family partition protein
MYGGGGDIQDTIKTNRFLAYFFSIMETIELKFLDLRLEQTRTRNSAVEQALMQSIAQHGILDPLYVAGGAHEQEYILLDGFKRYRCARKLGMGMAPSQCIAGDLATGILTVIRRGDYDSGVTALEQAALIEELHQRCGLTIYDIAVQLDRSPSWVSMRLGMLEDLSDFVREKIMSGEFPARAYLYGIKGFTRVNKIGTQQVDTFVGAVSGQGLSTRELFVLSRAYFSGGEAIRRLIGEGKIIRALRLLMEDSQGVDDTALSERERQFIKDLSEISSGMNCIIANAAGMGEGSSSFILYVNLWCSAILRRQEEFSTIIKELYDRSRPAGRSTDALSRGSEPQGNSAPAAH